MPMAAHNQVHVEGTNCMYIKARIEEQGIPPACTFYITWGERANGEPYTIFICRM